MSKEKADLYINEARDIIGGRDRAFAWLRSFLADVDVSEKYNKLYELYRDAAIEQEAAGVWNDAKYCFWIADSYAETSKMVTADARFDCMRRAATCVEQVDADSSLYEYEKAARFAEENQIYDQAATLWIYVGNIHARAHRDSAAHRCFKKAYSLVQKGGLCGSALGFDCQERFTKSLVQRKDFVRAAKLYWDLATTSVSDQKIFAAKLKFRNCLLCYLAGGNIDECAAYLLSCTEMDPTFASSAEYDLIARLMVAVSTRSRIDTTIALKNYGRIFTGTTAMKIVEAIREHTI